jgi:hypothetical protein
MVYDIAEQAGNSAIARAQIDVLSAEYGRYVRDEHAICRRCPVVRSGVSIVRTMLEWKRTQPDDRLHHWTRPDIRNFLLGHLPGRAASHAFIEDAPACAKDLMYFLSDRGMLTGDEVDVLTDAADGVLYRQFRVADLIARGPTPAPGDNRRARRRAARVARKRNRTR